MIPIVDNPLVLEFGEQFVFPDPNEADDDGLVAIGGDFHPARLVQAYKQGIFPWFIDHGYIFWYSPDPRLILYPAEFKTSRSLKKKIQKNCFEIRFDTSFEAVMQNCTDLREESGCGSWITQEFIDAYTALHKLGFASSVESWMNGELVGGLYGVRLGGIFFGESMFSRVTDASKVALYALCSTSETLGIKLIDCQQATAHLISLGAKEISRSDFLQILKEEFKN